ncbi:hypothetical protein HY493_00545 [Candidatus Woesearchaeota archaeon]|nr:hypothetical protein [Candidatus Woesearchaeota archaeon]
MPLAEDYVCYSVLRGQVQHGIAAKTLIDIGVGCSVTAVQAERIARFAAKSLRVELQDVYIKNHLTRGHARETDIMLPHWVLHRAKPFVVYYIVHEVAHLHPDAHGHERSFKRVERRALKRFGLGIRYMHAYPRVLFSLKDGHDLWEDPRQYALRLMREETVHLREREAKLQIAPTPITTSSEAQA